MVVAFTNGLRKGKFFFSLYKNDPKTMSEVLYRATKYMNAKTHYQLGKTNPERERDLKMPVRTMGGRNRGRETDTMKSVPNLQEEDLHASLP